uniref:KASH domain-containing protein n=1 Tax=Knipowitschia caucasica TaxID=637954 RepID=A0AAV2JH51_KNICA
MSTSERPQTNSEEKDKEAMGEVTQVPIDGKGPLTLEESTLKQDPALDVLTSTDEVPSNVLEAAVSVTEDQEELQETDRGDETLEVVVKEQEGNNAPDNEQTSGELTFEIGRDKPTPVQKKVSATETDALKIPESSSTSAGADGTQLQGLGTPQETIAANEEEPESVMTNIFSEIQLLMESGPSCQLIQVKPVEPTPEAQFLSSAPDQDHVDQLLVRVLVCKNQPVPTSPRAAEGQLQEVQEVREASMVLLSLLCDLRREDQVSSQASELVEDQVRSWVQDLDSLVLKKQSELQLVSDYTHQQQQAQTGLEETRQDQASLSAGHNCSEEVQRLRSLQRTLEKRRSVLLQLKVLHKKLLLVLSRSDQASARDQLRNLQDQWRRVEREVQGSLYHKNAISYKTECLKAEVDLLTSQLQDISNELQMISTRGWTSNEAQKLMVLNAELSAACHKYSCLKDLAEEVSAHSQWEKDREEIRDGLQRVERELSQCQEDIGSKSQSSSNPIMEKILEVMRNAFAWARKTETDIEGRRRRVCLLPEQVHRQLRDLKKLQFEVTNKQGQLEALEEEVHELLPQLHEEDEAPMINASLKSLEELSKLTMEKLVQTIRETESGLQTRERLSQQLSDLETWILTYFSKDPFCSSDLQMSSQDLELQARRTLESQEEAEKQAAICEALLVTSKEIASELSVAENCHLFDRLLHLQDCIQDITEEEQSNKEEIQESIRMVESSRQKLVPIEKSLRHMLVDLSRPKFPVTRKSLLALRPLRNTLAEHKSQVERLERWSTQEKTKELQSLITNLETKMSALEPKATDHELYLDLRRFLEELKEAMKDQVRRAKDGSDDIHKYKRCQSLLVQFPTINVLCQEVKSKLQEISADLYPSQLSSEQQRQKQAEEALAAMETSLDNTLTIIEGTLLKHLDLQTETRSSRAFLNTTLKALDQVELQELSKPAVDGEYQRLLTLRRTIKLRLRAWDVLRRKGNKWEPATADINQLKTRVLQECDTQLEHLSEVRDSFRSFSSTLRRLVLVLVLVDLRLRRGVGPRGLCSERWQQIQSSLDSLDQDFQRLQDQLSSCFRANRLLPVSVVQQHLEETLSQLLLMKTTVKARARLQLEALSSCVEEQRLYCKLRDDVTQRLEKAEESVNELMSRRVSSLHDCEQQQQQLQTLSSELESLLRSCCPESSCRGHREATVVRVFSRLSSVWRHCHILRHRSNKRIRDWAQVTVCVEEAETTLSLLEQDLPSLLPLHSPIEQPLLPLLSPTEELAELVQTWDQFQDRVDCEQRSVLALELRVARLVGVSAHMDQAPPTALCQRLQGLHQQYQRVSESSSLGLSSCRSELEQRETTRGELQRLRLRLEETDHLLSQRHPRDIQVRQGPGETDYLLSQRHPWDIQVRQGPGETDHLLSQRHPWDIQVRQGPGETDHLLSQRHPRDIQVRQGPGETDHHLSQRHPRDIQVRQGSGETDHLLSQRHPRDIQVRQGPGETDHLLSQRHPWDIQVRQGPGETDHLLSQRYPRDIQVRQGLGDTDHLLSQRHPRDIQVRQGPGETDHLLSQRHPRDIQVRQGLGDTDHHLSQRHPRDIQVRQGPGETDHHLSQRHPRDIQVRQGPGETDHLLSQRHPRDIQVRQGPGETDHLLSQRHPRDIQVRQGPGETDHHLSQRHPRDIQVRQGPGETDHLLSQRHPRDIQRHPRDIQVRQGPGETDHHLSQRHPRDIQVRQGPGETDHLLSQRHPRDIQVRQGPGETDHLLSQRHPRDIQVRQGPGETDHLLSQRHPRDIQVRQGPGDTDHHLSQRHPRDIQVRQGPGETDHHLSQKHPRDIQVRQGPGETDHLLSQRHPRDIQVRQGPGETDHLLSQRHPRDIQMVLLQFLAHKSELYKISTSICNKYQTRPETGPETRPEIRPETEPETGPQIRPGFGPESLIPGEILTLLQETRAIMDQVEPKVQDAVEKSGSVYRLGMKLSEIQSGLNSVQKRLDQRSPTVAEAKVTQKRVWDELDVWHSCLAALEVEVQDLERPEEALLLTERLVEVQHIHTQLAKRAEQRTTLISKIHSWQQEHQEMILSSQSWINEAKTWLAAPATYTSAKCLTSHVHALQVVLGDSEQIRSTLRSFSLILDDMSEVCDITALQNQLQDQDRDVARVQDSFTEPLSRLRQAAAEAESIEAEVRQMEKDVSEIKELLVSPENTPGSRLQRLKLVEEKISQMQRTISEVQSRRLVQDLPQTLCVFTVIDHLHTLIQELHKNVPVLFVPQQNSPRQSPFLPRQTAEAPPPASSSPYHTPRQSPFMPQFKNAEEGEGQVSRLKEDVLKSPGAELQTVKTCDITQSTGASPSDGASGVMWWLWDRFVADTAQVKGPW